jgi:predicted nucleic acid-binding protein
MKVYWDSSALVAALNGEQDALASLAKDQTRCTRVHTLAETFSQLTGGRLGRKFLPDDAARMIRENTDNFEFVELTRADAIRALEAAGSDGVRGGLVHDYLHVAAAHKANALHICTYNVNDFRPFTRLEVGLF